LLNNNKIAN